MTERERLIKLIDDGCFEACKKKNDDVKLAHYLADFLLENNVLPLEIKPGDTVYINGLALKVSFVHIDDKVYYCVQIECAGEDCRECPLFFIGSEYCNGYIEFTADDIGKTVFLTKGCKNA